MRRTVASIVLGLLTAGSAPALAASAAPRKVSMAVMEFRLALKAGVGRHATIRTDVLTEKLKTALTATRKFDVVERQDLDMLVDEMKLAGSPLGDKTRGPRTGKVVGADYMVTGEISLIEAGTTARPIPSTERYNQITSGTIVCDLRVIDTQRSVIATAAKVEASTSRKVITADPVTGPVDDLFMEDLQRQLVEKMANRVIETVFPTKVVAVEAGIVYLNRGQGGGLAVGDMLTVFETGQAIVDPDTGETLGATESAVATLEVTEVLPKMTKARVVHGSGLRIGMLARAESELPEQ